MLGNYSWPRAMKSNDYNALPPLKHNVVDLRVLYGGGGGGGGAKLRTRAARNLSSAQSQECRRYKKIYQIKYIEMFLSFFCPFRNG